LAPAAVDRQDGQPALGGGGADLGRRRAVDQRHALEVVADLDQIQAEAFGEIKEGGMRQSRRDHVVERELHGKNSWFWRGRERSSAARLGEGGRAAVGAAGASVSGRFQATL